MRNDGYRPGSELVEDRLRARVEEQIGVQVGDRFDVGNSIEQVQRQGRREREVVLDRRSVLPRFKERRIGLLDVRETNGLERFESQGRDGSVGVVIQAQGPQRERWAMANQ